MWKVSGVFRAKFKEAALSLKAPWALAPVFVMKPFLKLQSLPEVLSLLAGFSGKDEAEEVPLDESLGRYLAEDLVSDQDVPGFCRSTVDGFAVRAQDVFGAGESQPALLELAESCRMGVRVTQSLEPGQAAPILTGGMLPKGSDAVVMLEYSRPAGNDLIELTRSVAPGDNVLARDEDVAEGMLCLKKGLRIRPQDVGLLAALGRTRVSVARRPRVAIISTGDEVVPCDTTPAPGQIRDVNSHSIAALCREEGAEVEFAGILRDDEGALRDRVDALCRDFDVVLVSGGSSAGMRDHTLDAFCQGEESELLCHGVALSPGNPFILARRGRVCLMGLPGHVTSALVCARCFVRPLLRRLQGGDANVLQGFVLARLSRPIASAQGRRDYIRVTLEPMEREGVCDRVEVSFLAVPVTAPSGCISSLTRADGLVVCPEQSEGLYEGELIEVELLR